MRIIFYHRPDDPGSQKAQNHRQYRADLSDTEALVKQGRYEAALDRFLWHHDHALEHQPSMFALRLSFGLTSWKELLDVCPPAMTALKKTREDKTAGIAAGQGNRHLIHTAVVLENTNAAKKSQTEAASIAR